jgi:hypothetical protein
VSSSTGPATHLRVCSFWFTGYPEVPKNAVLSGWATILPELTRQYAIGAGNVPQGVLVNPRS